MIRLTTEQAQQIEEALDTAYGLAESNWTERKYADALALLRAAKAQEQAKQEPCKECGAKQAQIDRLMLEYCPDEMTPEQMQEWEKNIKPFVDPVKQEPFNMDDHPPHRLCECRKCIEYFTPLPDCDAFAASGKPIAGQTNTQLMEGFRPVSEMIAEHKQDPKKAAAIEKSKMRKAGQEPVAWRVRGYNQFKTGNPAPWRYVDGVDKPSVNKPDCCDFEPLYAAPLAQQDTHATHVVRTKDLTVDEKVALADRLNLNGRIVVIDAVIAADRSKNNVK